MPKTKKRYEICVTKKDIKNGASYSNYSCAIALALKRRFGKEAYVGTWPFLNLYIQDKSTINLNCSTPKEIQQVQRFIQNFDNQDKRRYCRPFKFFVTKHFT